MSLFEDFSKQTYLRLRRLLDNFSKMHNKSDLDQPFYQDNSAEKENVGFSVINDIKDNFNDVKNAPNFGKCVENANISMNHTLNENKLTNNELNSETNAMIIKNKIKNQINGKEVPFSQ